MMNTSSFIAYLAFMVKFKYLWDYESGVHIGLTFEKRELLKEILNQDFSFRTWEQQFPEFNDTELGAVALLHFTRLGDEIARGRMFPNLWMHKHEIVYAYVSMDV